MYDHRQSGGPLLRLLLPARQLSQPVRLICREAKPDRLLAELALHTLDVVLSDASTARSSPCHSPEALQPSDAGRSAADRARFRLKTPPGRCLDQREQHWPHVAG